MRLLNCVVLLFFILTSTASAGQWRTVAPVPAILPSASAITIGDQIYVLSGTVGHGLRQFFEMYDPLDDGWRPLTPLPANVDRFAASKINGRIVVTGGVDRQSGEAVSGAWLYVHESALWIEIVALPEAVSGHSMVEFDGALYLIGGEGKDNFWRLDRELQQWKTLPALPIKTSGAVAASDDDYIYVVNGADLWQWSPDKGWKKQPGLPEAVSNPAVAVMSDGLHVIGGYSKDKKTALASHYVFQKGAWKPLPALPQGRHLMGAAVFNERLYIIGGASAGGFFSFFTGSDNLYVFEE